MVPNVAVFCEKTKNHRKKIGFYDFFGIIFVFEP
jgi:hypothetical protein